MLVTANGFSVLLRTLGLSQGLFKPFPSVTSGLGNLADAFGFVGGIQALSPTSNTSSLNISNSIASHNNSHTLSSHSAVSIQRREYCSDAQYNSPDVGYQNFSPYDQTKATVFRYRQQQSVNLGSWSVSPSVTR